MVEKKGKEKAGRVREGVGERRPLHTAGNFGTPSHLLGAVVKVEADRVDNLGERALVLGLDVSQSQAGGRLLVHDCAKAGLGLHGKKTQGGWVRKNTVEMPSRAFSCLQNTHLHNAVGHVHLAAEGREPHNKLRVLQKEKGGRDADGRR